MNKANGKSTENGDSLENFRQEAEYYRDILQVVSHEIKNTATSIHGYNRMSRRYLQTGETEELQETTDNIDRLSMILYGLCESLYYLTITDQNKLKVTNKPVDLLSNALNPVLEEMQKEFENHDLKIKVDSSTESMLILGEDRLLRIVFRNILKNAILFSDRGKNISIAMRKKKRGFFITIKNYGPGFEPQELETIFNRYVTINPRIRKNPGYNLFIVRRIIEMHGGSITAEKDRGDWMHFSIQLPVID